jgi:tetratricopeptide (TPR) repeat protein
MAACALAACSSATRQPAGESSGAYTGLVGVARAAADAAREIEKASITGDVNRMGRAHDMIDRALVTFPNDPLLLHYQGWQRYNEANLMDGIGERQEVPALLDRARAALEQSNALQPMPETQALLASVLGRMIGATQSLAPTLGPQVQQQMQAARQSGPNNPRVWLLQGINSIYTPAQYGGGLSVAESQLRQAIALFQTDQVMPPAPSWGRAEAYAWLGQVLQKENRPADAVAAYNQALAIAPDYTWVKTVLLPSARR